MGPPGELPPLLVLAHGGPTASARRQLQPSILYWTSRGVAVVDVDYRGSTGYGRGYRRALDGGWGVIDVADCAAAAEYLVERGDADPERLVIRGSSAGGLTVLAALALHDTFAAGASRYGVADLTALPPTPTSSSPATSTPSSAPTPRPAPSTKSAPRSTTWRPSTPP